MTIRAPLYTKIYRPDWTRAVNALSQGLNLNLFGGGVEPFYQTDWPNPRGYPFPIGNRTWLQSGLALIGGGIEPFYQTDWPNPRGYPFPVENRTWLQSVNLSLQQPFNQTDWPNPRGYPFPTENRTWLQSGNSIIGGGIEPFAQYDWPNPRGPQFPVENRTWLQSFSLPQSVVATPAPFAEYDWPNPRGYPFPIENRGWLYNQTINLPAPAPVPVSGVGRTRRARREILLRDGVRVVTNSKRIDWERSPEPPTTRESRAPKAAPRRREASPAPRGEPSFKGGLLGAAAKGAYAPALPPAAPTITAEQVGRLFEQTTRKREKKLAAKARELAEAAAREAELDDEEALLQIILASL